MDSKSRQIAAGTTGCILFVLLGMMSFTPDILPAFAPPSIQGLNPNAHVPLPPVTGDASSSPNGSSSHPKTAWKSKGASPVIATDLDHLALSVEHQLCLAAAAGITQIGRLITWSINHC